MTAPVIGVCAAYERARWSFWDMPAAIVASTYLDHLAESGAVPVALIPSEHTVARAHDLVGRVDGLLLLGGADVDPSFYGETPDPKLEATVTLRDSSEVALVRAAMEVGLPILGICRGLHLMNVATGGTLMQDVGEPGPERHRRTPGSLDSSTFHPVTIEKESWVGQVYGESAQVNSHHHQAVKDLGRGARVTATSPDDGVVEAAEWSSSAFTVGVQWHPEAAEFGHIIARFLTECRARANAQRPTSAAQAKSLI